MITLSDPDAKLVANVLEQDIEQILDGQRREPAPNGVTRLENICAKLRGPELRDGTR